MLGSAQVETSSWMYPSDGRGRGLRRGSRIRPGLSVALADVKYDEDTRSRFGCPGDYLRLHFRLSGPSEIGERDNALMPIDPGRISLCVQPPDCDKREIVSVNTHERSVTLVCDRDFASSILSSRDHLTPCLEQFVRGRVSRMTVESYPLPLPLRGLVEEILAPPLEDELASLLVESHALELLSRTVHQVLNVPISEHRIRQRDKRRVEELCTLIDTDPATTLSISAMCKMLAWNESQMMESFKAVTGTTIYSYRNQMRMSRARRQLEETDEPVTQIAFDAGFEHPGNFATAFKRTFGIPPSSLRRGRA